MNILKELILKSLVLLAVIVITGRVYAQDNFDDVFEVTKHMKENDLKYTLNFVKEENKLKVDKGLYTIERNDNEVLVAILARNEAGNQKKGGDYSNYWKDKKKTSDRYTWVFIPNDFIRKYVEKNIDKIYDPDKKKQNILLSKRLSQLLGLDDKVLRDTIIYMKVPKESLFRPAYNPSIYEQVNVATNEKINQLPPADKNGMWHYKIFCVNGKYGIQV